MIDPEHVEATRRELIFQLRSGDAHQSFADAVAGFPAEAINVHPAHVDYSFWHLVEHVRYCQRDMLEYLREPGYEAGRFPDDYWPSPDSIASEEQWHESVQRFLADLDEVEAFVMDPSTELWRPAPWAWEPGHTPLRTVMVMVDHNAYHGGEMGILRQVMGLWAPTRVDHFTIEAIDSQNQP